jgi:hypothetical protein
MVLAALLLAAPAARAACLLPGETPMVLVTLYFGESIPHRAPLSAAQWQHFAADVLTPAFPDGFTVTDGQGQWEDDETHRIIHESSKVFTVAAEPGPALADKIKTVTGVYDKAFDQESVGITTQPVCGAF